jgi:hypothetical protein
MAGILGPRWIYRPRHWTTSILLPRPLLLSAVRRGLDEQAIAAKYDVTTEMARFRLNRTGVRRQVRSTHQRRDIRA